MIRSCTHDTVDDWYCGCFCMSGGSINHPNEEDDIPQAYYQDFTIFSLFSKGLISCNIHKPNTLTVNNKSLYF